MQQLGHYMGPGKRPGRHYWGGCALLELWHLGARQDTTLFSTSGGPPAGFLFTARNMLLPPTLLRPRFLLTAPARPLTAQPPRPTLWPTAREHCLFKLST